MTRTLRRLLLPCLLALSLSAGLVLASSAPQVTYLPALIRSTIPAVLHVPADIMVDSPEPRYDGSGTLFVAVQTIVGKEHVKIAVVYRLNPNGQLDEVVRDTDIYGAPKWLIEPDGDAVIFGADRDGGLHWAVVPGWQP